MLFWERLLLRRRIRACRNHHWTTLMSSDKLWWHAAMGVDIYKGDTPPSSAWWTEGWHRARFLVCKKCGGTLDEITFCQNVLDSGETTFYRSNESQSLLSGCGSIEDFH